MLTGKYPSNVLIRRIDDLGRIVINKEFRRNLRIKDGDPMAVWTEGNRVIMERYSELDAFAIESQLWAEVIARRTSSVCLIANRHEFIAAAGSKLVESRAIGQSIGLAVQQVMDDHTYSKTRFHWRDEHGNATKEMHISGEAGSTFVEEICIHPIISDDREAVGAIVIFRPGAQVMGSKYVQAPAYEAQDFTAVEMAADVLILKVEGGK